ncbi:cytochrome d ubiquinol oxidase subunit II [Rhizobium phaseoli]|uniref:Cytochrome bd ubiquinol oxidase protein, subunit II n=1 Tax=Rhizobium etli (strain CIAT 652) TaxID=491916 RepID=B3Q4X4_RHIE6|nr:cytochrome d ubiquinol oxidase subunit II [Rhizobium phaseoli]ACE94255.1 cytochrome bd ubiquinol oxidase protein, subunit II [Rhizobium etli CIAT 652]MDH6645454.1 cytochrome d ubiquinol oxidase subunit II [Rhizobium esperanzae]MDK4724875.1 cytochrome d ubiquinol oxidase subunit II [Rhizobium phaseoli]NKE86124.1 cytochrome d ubiquinol oxidase subunit II [Rhizobium phaseoli]PCD68426.1 cytochrome d ubiquinol oxidase subunit II [Rhizobium phaseoli]
MILHEFIDYETLRVIWWLLLGVVLIAFAATGGFDLGVGTLLPFVARTDTERRVAINTIGATWEGNQVWLILGGGAIFAAWPPLYAVSFSGFYLAMFAILFALILRPVGFKYRSKRDSARWRSGWDWALFVGGFVPSLIFGVAVGNVLQGVPFRFADDMRIFYEGSFFALLNPYALLCGLLSVAMLTMHGAAWLVVKASGPVAERARSYGSIAALAAILLFALGGLFLWTGVSGYRITSDISPIGPSNPLLKTVVIENGAWLANYSAHSWMIVAPILGFAGAALAFIAMRARREVITLIFSKIAILGIISTVGLSMFPFILPSSLDPRSSLTVWDASSSHQTLFIMLVVSAIFLPIIVAYTAWVYKVLWGKVDEKSVTDKNSHAY